MNNPTCSFPVAAPMCPSFLGLVLLAWCFVSSAVHLVSPAAATAETMANVSGGKPRVVMYLTAQHPDPPQPDNPDAFDALHAVTHVALAFLSSNIFNSDQPVNKWPLFTDVASVRRIFPPSTRVLIAIGGWGDTAGFDAAARNLQSRQHWAGRVANMVEDTGADGVDVDWEYPGGNGEDYLRVPSSERAWEVEAYPLLVAALRAALGHERIISAAVPGLERDMLAFSAETIPSVMASLDFINVMTYDLMNRRDNTTGHHTGVSASLASIDAYISRGVAPSAINLGFGFYARWFLTEEISADAASPLGHPTLLLEDPVTGEDLGRCGACCWNDPLPAKLAASLARARGPAGRHDTDGSFYYWDAAERIWWTMDDKSSLRAKMLHVLVRRRLGGVFAWGLGEDGPAFDHFTALVHAVRDLSTARDEL